MPVQLSERKIKVLTGIGIGAILASFISAIVYGTYFIKESRLFDEEFVFPMATNTVEVPKDWNM